MATDLFAGLRTRLDTRLRDVGDITWSSAEKDEIMKIAINDTFVYRYEKDTSLTTVVNQPSYSLPATVQALTEVGIDTDGTGYPLHLDVSDWQVINNVLWFEKRYKGIPSGKTIHLIFKRKLTITDTIDDFLWEYVLELCMIEAFEMLKSSLTSRFVKNDMTMADIVNSISTHKTRAEELRRNLHNTRLITL